MNIILTTVPIRDAPDSFPPIASLSLINAARKQGFDEIEFYHIDYLRPTYAHVLEHLREAAPEVLAISAVVSTSYDYVKRLSLDFKAMFPDSLVVLGGNMAASSNVLLRRTGVDLCVLGEGERVFCNILRRAEETTRAHDFQDIPGLALLDADEQLINTGYEVPLQGEEIYDIDWNDLERAADIDFYIFDVFDENGDCVSWFRDDPRAHEPHRRRKKVATLTASKGCVARCTFCHRWDKGLRFIPLDVFLARLSDLIERYDVGFLALGDENFGSDRAWVEEFCREIKRHDILWHVAGIRARTVDAEYIGMMKDAGCSDLIFGIESGSQRMLDVMEKKITVEQNRNALQWTAEAGLRTVLQLVIGMPGETRETIAETAEFAAFVQSLSPAQNPNRMSINYAQALPGTPLYEFGREKGLIGGGLDGEEAYLLQVSDTNAAEKMNSLNFTDNPRLVWLTWSFMFRAEVRLAYVRKFGIEQYHKVVFDDIEWVGGGWKTIGYHTNRNPGSVEARNDYEALGELPDDRSGFRAPRAWDVFRTGGISLLALYYPVQAYWFRNFAIVAEFLKVGRKRGLLYALSLVGECIQFGFAKSTKRVSLSIVGEYKSLRKIVKPGLDAQAPEDPAMVPLRRGR